MIVLISIDTSRDYWLNPGDTFNLTYHETYIGGLKSEDKIISEIFDKSMRINYIASFVFALEDGKIVSPNACGFFGDKNDLPKEIKEAKSWKDLTIEQQSNFEKSSVFKLKR